MTGAGSRWLRTLLCAYCCAVLPLSAQPALAAPEIGMPALVLKPGEGLALAIEGGDIRTFGEARAVTPMGGLAKLVWLRMEGATWSSGGVKFRCAGAAGSLACGGAPGHGTVTLAKALQEDCDLAFLAWISGAQGHWLQDYGPEVARYRLQEVFEPFLGRRLPAGQGLPVLTAPWVGDGDLLRTSPEAFLRWLLLPENAEVAGFGRRLLAGYWAEVNVLLGRESWWFKTALARVPGEPSVTSAWVAGGRGSTLVVFRAPPGTSRPAALARLRELLGLKP